jgi:hypothetical protein
MKAFPSFAGAILAAGAFLSGSGSGAARGETFSFGGNQNGFSGQPSAMLTAGPFELHLEAGIAGTLLNEPQGAGMGINSSAVGVDPVPALFNTIEGLGPLAGAAESVRFSFNRAGKLTGMNFDGVKDESLEYFVLTSSGGVRVNFFDSAANTTVPGAVDAAVLGGAVTGAVEYLLEIDDTIDDEAQALSIPFAAGQQFDLAFFALGAEFGPTEAANGARLQGITVAPVPEPTALIAAAMAALSALSFVVRRRNSRGFVFGFPCS